VVDDELKVLEANGLVLVELNAEQGDVTGSNGGFTYNEPSKHLEEKHTANPPSCHANCQCFFCTGKNRVVKIAYSSSEVVLQTTKHTVIYNNSGPSLEVIALRLVV
jgi:hypothetical protein